MAIDIKKYAEELFATAGVSDDNVKQAVTNFLSNETVAKRLGDDMLRQQDYSRNMDTLAAEKQKAADYYATLVTWKQEQDAAAGTQQRQQQQQQTGLLTVDELNKVKTEFDQRLQQQEVNYISLLKGMGDITSDYVTRFHEKPDLNAIEKIAMDKKVPLMQAYQEYIAPRVQSSQETAFAEKLKAAREEGAREFASTHKIPVDTQPREYHTLFDQDRKKQVGIDDYVPGSGTLSPAANRTLEGNFADAWNTATARTSAAK